MDVMNDQIRVPRLMKSQNKNNCKAKKKGAKNSLKVVYISSPMKVKTSPSRFRALVQELTGKNSDMSHFDDIRDFYEDDDEYRSDLVKDTRQIVSSSISSEDNTPTSSDSFLGPIGNVPLDAVFMSQMEDQFGGVFSSGSLCEMDVLGSYDELL